MGSTLLPGMNAKSSDAFVRGLQMGSSRLLRANISESRIFKFSKAFYSIFDQRRKKIIFGERPEDLQEVKSIDKRIWEKHQTYLRRIENFPLKKAAYYRRLQESTGIKSVRGLSEITGEDCGRILPEFLKPWNWPNPSKFSLFKISMRLL